MRFTKMHGAGNDYVYIDGFNHQLPDAPSVLAQQVSDRHTGIGSDGLILICPSEIADAEMRMFNADGSESEMCGNGIRCVAKYLHDHKIVNNSNLAIATGAGIKTVEIVGQQAEATLVRVDMGEPALGPADIPTTLGSDGRVVNEELRAGGYSVRVTCVSMGNPHCVVFQSQNEEIFTKLGIDRITQELGPLIENHECFPSRTNVEIVTIESKDSVTQRTWERGSGETLACGTGACAVCVAGVLNSQTNSVIRCELKGGALQLEWDEQSNHVFMTGPAVEVYQGELLLGTIVG